MPEDARAFAYRTVGTESHHLMLSIFPYDETDTVGLQQGLNIEMTFYSKTWRTVGSFNAPN